ncbi:uncharacterized protein FFNC_15690 [Fusarium fujikuroi]|nr:uncharacterized protein FFNC_15690 [Fusarium fujikuroi]
MDPDPKRRESMGQIKVEVWYGKQHLMIKKYALNGPLRPLSKAIFKDLIIGNEDITHGTCYQNTKSDHSPSFCRYLFDPIKDIGIFHFHHRSYDKLVTKGVTSSGIHALGVLPSPVSSGTEERAVIDLTGDDD